MKTLHLNIPQAWNDLSPIQTKNICYTHYCNIQGIKNKPTEKDAINTATFFIIAKELLRSNGFFKTRTALKELRVKAYTTLVEFIFKSVDLHRFPKTVTIKNNLLERFKLYGPHFRLKNISIGEFSFADALYYRWKQTNDQVYLNLLCATLYRYKINYNKTTKELTRQPFNKVQAEINTGLFIKLPFKTKLAIAYAFEGTRNYIVNLHPLVFPKLPQSSETKKLKPQKYVPFGELISSKIQYDPSKLATVEDMNVYKFFALYQNELKEIKKIK